ncbi:hypothetical protein GCM10011408_23760 [Dyella caseinilytica]|nr:hypothetical protein GCM10011408_23760 [Dyella caseinilytica]
MVGAAIDKSGVSGVDEQICRVELRPDEAGVNRMNALLGHGECPMAASIWIVPKAILIVLASIFKMSPIFMKWGGSYDHQTCVPSNGVVLQAVKA